MLFYLTTGNIVDLFLILKKKEADNVEGASAN